MSKAWLVAGFFALYLAGLVAAQDLEPQPFKFGWKPTEGAGGYLAEVQGLTGQPVTSQQVSGAVSSITLKLVPGSYQLKMTTLNRLLQPESATDWIPIHVPAAGPPTVGTVPLTQLVPGQTATLVVPVTGLASDATVSLVAPSGQSIVVPISAPAEGKLTLTLPVLTERGEYTILLTNPPKLTARIAGKLGVHYADPVVEKVVPPFLGKSELAQAIRFTGQNFSGEAIVVLQSEAGQQIGLPVREHTDTRLTAVVAATIPVGNYQILVANAPDELPVTVGDFSIKLAPKIGSVVASTGSLAIKLVSAGTVTVLGQTLQVPSGGSVPVKDVPVGDQAVQVLYADGQKETRTVTIAADQETAVVFSEKPRSSSPAFTSRHQNGRFTSWSKDWKFPERGTGVLLFQASDFPEICFSDIAGFTGDVYEISSEGNSFLLYRVGGSDAKGGTSRLAGVYKGAHVAGGYYWLSLDKKSKRIAFGAGAEPEKSILFEFVDQGFLKNVSYFSLSSLRNDVAYSDIEVRELPSAGGAN